MHPVQSSSLICGGKLSTWSSLHPLLPLALQCGSLCAIISGSFRTTSLSFTLGSISMSSEGISKARSRYIIQAWSSCPGLILTRSQVGHMLQLNSPSPYPRVVLTNYSPPVRRQHRGKVLMWTDPIWIQSRKMKSYSWKMKTGETSRWRLDHLVTIIQDRLRCDKNPNNFRAPKDKPAMHLQDGKWSAIWDFQSRPGKPRELQRCAGRCLLILA